MNERFESVEEIEKSPNAYVEDIRRIFAEDQKRFDRIEALFDNISAAFKEITEEIRKLRSELHKKKLV